MENVRLMLQKVVENFGAYLPKVLGALFILIVGWIFAKALSVALKHLINKLHVSEKISKVAGTSVTLEEENTLADGHSKPDNQYGIWIIARSHSYCNSTGFWIGGSRLGSLST